MCVTSDLPPRCGVSRATSTWGQEKARTQPDAQGSTASPVLCWRRFVTSYNGDRKLRNKDMV